MQCLELLDGVNPMGFYLNPGDGSTTAKREWLEANGRMVSINLISNDSTMLLLQQLQPGEHLVCFVDNGWMTAAGIAFDAGEAQAFNEPSDQRPKAWYAVPDKALIAECPHVADTLR